MLAAFSFTNILCRVLDGDIPIDSLEGPNVRFYLGCAREHLTNGIPFEATWHNEIKPKVYDGRTEVREDEIDDDLLPAVKVIVDIILKASTEGRVTWKCGPAAEVIKTLPPDTVVLLHRNQPKTAAEWVAEWKS